MSDVIDEAKKSLEGVTPGPWAVMEKGFGKSDNGPTVYAADDELRYIAKVRDTFNVTPTPNTNNARFIAWAREGVPALLTEIAAMQTRAEAAELREKALLDGTEINRKTTLAHNAAHARQIAAKDAEIADLREYRMLSEMSDAGTISDEGYVRLCRLKRNTPQGGATGGGTGC